MKIYSPEQLVGRSFNTVFINSLKQYWQTTRSFSCLGAPKKEDLLLYINGFSVCYTDKDGKTVVAGSGDIVYTPRGSEYRCEISDGSAGAYTVGINLLLFDEMGDEVALSDGVKVFSGGGRRNLAMLFDSVLRYDGERGYTRRRILLMEIISALVGEASDGMQNERIAPAVKYLYEHIEENPQVSALAALCNISEVYFRRLFKSELGISPLEYRNTLRLERASSYLEYGEISVQEISDTLGYASVSHFIKEFKRYKGVSPLKYRKNSAR
jgi:AraC-like DNA-binding protein